MSKMCIYKCTFCWFTYLLILPFDWAFNPNMWKLYIFASVTSQQYILKILHFFTQEEVTSTSMHDICQQLKRFLFFSLAQISKKEKMTKKREK